jgi:hypothetical protein
MSSASYTQDLINKIRALPEDKIAEVADFVEFLGLKAEERRAAASVAKLSEPAFSKLWDNPDDAEYDSL